MLFASTDWGPVSGWFSGSVSSLVLVWALASWALERRRRRHEEGQRTVTAALDRAYHIGAWMQPLNPTLRTASMDGEHAAIVDGCPCVVLVNGSALPVYSWKVVVTSPGGNSELEGRNYGLIPPNRSPRVIPIRTLVGVTGAVVAEFEYSIGASDHWRRDQFGTVVRDSRIDKANG